MYNKYREKYEEKYKGGLPIDKQVFTPEELDRMEDFELGIFAEISDLNLVLCDEACRRTDKYVPGFYERWVKEMDADWKRGMVFTAMAVLTNLYDCQNNPVMVPMIRPKKAQKPMPDPDKDYTVEELREMDNDDILSLGLTVENYQGPVFREFFLRAQQWEPGLLKRWELLNKNDEKQVSDLIVHAAHLIGDHMNDDEWDAELMEQEESESKWEVSKHGNYPAFLDDPDFGEPEPYPEPEFVSFEETIGDNIDPYDDYASYDDLENPYEYLEDSIDLMLEARQKAEEEEWEELEEFEEFEEENPEDEYVDDFDPEDYDTEDPRITGIPQENPYESYDDENPLRDTIDPYDEFASYDDMENPYELFEPDIDSMVEASEKAYEEELKELYEEEE